MHGWFLLGTLRLALILACPLCALFLVVDVPVGTQRQIFMVHAVQQASEIPQLLFDEVVDVLFFAPVVTPAQMLCILAGMNQNDSYAAMAVYIFSSRCVPFFIRQDARHLGWLGPEGQLRSEDRLRSSSLRQWHVYCWYAGVDAMRAVFLLMVGRPVMPGIMGVANLVVPASRAAPS